MRVTLVSSKGIFRCIYSEQMFNKEKNYNSVE